MPMLELTDVSLFVGKKLVLDGVNLIINPGDRIGIVGRNGVGKSQLMQVLEGVISPDAGVRKQDKRATVLLVKQELPDDAKNPIDYLRENDPDIQELEEQLDASDSDYVGEVTDRLAELDEERYETLAPKILMGLGLTPEQLKQPMRNLSGGLRMRIGFAMALVRTPDVLLLDEPTNHLDLESTQWLIEFLKQYSPNCAFVIVTHDIRLLMEVSTSTVHLRGGVLTQFAGNYELYRQQLETRKLKDIQSNDDLAKRIARQKEIYYRFRDLPESRAAQAVAQLKKAEKLEDQIVEIIQEEPVVELDFPEPVAMKDPILRLVNVCVGYSARPVLSDLNLSVQSGSKIGLLGRNGEGKSTLVKLLAGELEPMTGVVERGARLNVGYFSQELTDVLDAKLTVYEQVTKRTNLKADGDVRAFLGRYGFSHDKAGIRVENLSGGEKSRLLFALICAASPNLIILDEPTNHLDVETRAELIKAITQFKGCIILVSHDWDLHEKTMQQFWLAKEGKVQVYEKGLSHYQRQLIQFIETTLQGKTSKSQATSSHSSLKKSELRSSASIAAADSFFKPNSGVEAGKTKAKVATGAPQSTTPDGKGNKKRASAEHKAALPKADGGSSFKRS